ncbi:hypothetical protein D3C78_1381920 [compost metagenome]
MKATSTSAPSSSMATWGKKFLLPSTRPPRTLIRCTQAPPGVAKAAITSISPVPPSMLCWSCTRRRMEIWSRNSAARSKSRRMAASSMPLESSWDSALLRPSRNITEWRTSSAYSPGSTSPTHGALQRLIWYCRQGRVRFL